MTSKSPVVSNLEWRERERTRVPIRVNGEAAGVPAFSSQAPNAYGEEDISIAARIADHVSLALAHERLAARESLTHRPSARIVAR